MSPNSSNGTDHAQGGNYVMMGGGVQGGRIVGDYLSNVTDDEEGE